MTWGMWLKIYYGTTFFVDHLKKIRREQDLMPIAKIIDSFMMVTSKQIQDQELDLEQKRDNSTFEVTVVVDDWQRFSLILGLFYSQMVHVAKNSGNVQPAQEFGRTILQVLDSMGQLVEDGQ